jgi:hypothetical protein
VPAKKCSSEASQSNAWPDEERSMPACLRACLFFGVARRSGTQMGHGAKVAGPCFAAVRCPRAPAPACSATTGMPALLLQYHQHPWEESNKRRRCFDRLFVLLLQGFVNRVPGTY